MRLSHGQPNSHHPCLRPSVRPSILVCPRDNPNKDVTDGRTVGPVHYLSDVIDKFFEYSLEYAQICSDIP
jgi:hypothetical protein